MKWIAYSLLLFFTVSCSKTQDTNWDAEPGDKFLRNFYSSLYGSSEVYEIDDLKPFLSEKLYSKLDKLLNSIAQGDELVLDFDPFISAPNYTTDRIRSTLHIQPLENKNQFEVKLIPYPDAEESTIQFELKENVDGNLVIDKILNNDLFN